MERLVFNTAEHKLEELEKYGFVYVKEIYDDTYCYKRYESNWNGCIEVEDNRYTPKIIRINTGFSHSVAEELVVVLYKLIIDKLFIMEEIL